MNASSCGIGAWLAASRKVSGFLDVVDLGPGPELAVVSLTGSCGGSSPDSDPGLSRSSGLLATLLRQAIALRGGYFFTLGSSLDAGGSLRPDICRYAVIRDSQRGLLILLGSPSGADKFCDGGP